MENLIVSEPDFTYQNLQDYINNLTPEQKQQQVQIFGSNNNDEPILLDPVIEISTVKELCSASNGEEIQTTRSCLDFKHHPEQIVLLKDLCPFSKDGDIYYSLEEDDDGELIMIGNITGKVEPFVKRKDCEPTIKASKTPIFESKLNQSNEELMNRQEELAELAELSKTTKVWNRELDEIQAELYRRIYRINPKITKEICQ